jgi:hypothetical protein
VSLARPGGVAVTNMLERSGRVEIDDQLVFRRLLEREIGGFCTRLSGTHGTA